MANKEHLRIIQQGVEAWNGWRKDKTDVRPDLRGAKLGEANLIKADLRGANLEEANLRGADLFEANLIEAYLPRANLRGADLGGVNLRGANLYNVDLIEANLYRANLIKANLYRANLIKADLIRADLSETNLCEAVLIGADLSGAYLGWANLSGANLGGANLVETNLEHANLTGSHVYGISVWDINLTGAIQKDLVITKRDKPIIMVDDLEVAQFVYLLLHHDKLRNVLDAVTKTGVLLMGRFREGGLEMLKAMGERLRDLGYTPIIFDFDRPTDHDYTETVKTLVGLSHFVIVELSGPSVPYELGSTVFGFERPYALILEKGHEPFFMSRDLTKYPWVLQPVIEFESQEDLLNLLPERIVAPAEAYIEGRQQRLSTRDQN